VSLILTLQKIIVLQRSAHKAQYVLHNIDYKLHHSHIKPTEIVYLTSNNTPSDVRDFVRL
jgi:hypothetical protein